MIISIMYHCSSGLPRWKASSEHSSHESYSTLGQVLQGLHSPAEDTGHTRRLVFQMAPRVRKDSLKGQVASTLLSTAGSTTPVFCSFLESESQASFSIERESDPDF